MRKSTKTAWFFTLLGVALFALGACANDQANPPSAQQEASDQHGSMDHSEMHMPSSGEVPKDLNVAEKPAYPVGSKAIIKADHMEGMKGAEATIVGAYETVVYSISYTPTDGGAKINNHKWVIHEEIVDAGEAPLKPHTEVTLNADHMKGMDGASAQIETAEKTTVYMVDFTPATGGPEVKNHKWVTESELSPVP